MGLCGSSETNQVTVLETPISNFTSSVTGSTVSFTNTSSNVVFAMAMNWDFGDGTPSSNDLQILHIHIQLMELILFVWKL
jgi:PKD repeat protein